MNSLADSALLARAGPAGLGLAIDKRFRFPPHLQLINTEIMEAIARGKDRRRAIEAGEDIEDKPEILLIEAPPRHGKSTIVSEHTPPWYLGMFPDDRVILTTYEADFASTWGRKARDTLQEFGEQLYGVRVAEGSHSVKRWDLESRKGGMVTAGVGGPITGKGANLLLIDDPIKNAEEAMSEVVRKKQRDWWLTTARTRLEPGGVVIVLMTRWHEDDLGGQLLRAAEDGGDPVREIRLPSLAIAKDPLGREEGEALWPERYTRRYLENTRNVLGAYWFSAMYQGSPTPDEGGVFSRQYFRYFDLKGGQVVLDTLNGKVEYPASSCQKISYVDLAASEKSTGDYTVLTEVWVTPKQDMLVMNVTRDRIPGPDQPQFFEDHYVGRLKVESIGYQSSMIKQLLRKGLPVEPVYPDKDKVTRASAAGALYRGGKIFHRRGAEYLAEFEAELLAFPAGEHDDQVDTIAYAAKDLPTIDTQPARKSSTKGKTLTGGLTSREL